MIHDLLGLLKEKQGNVTKTELCRELNVSPARLDNMLLVLEQKGKIRFTPDSDTDSCKDVHQCPTTGKDCPGPTYCVLLMEMPLGIEIITK